MRRVATAALLATAALTAVADDSAPAAAPPAAAPVRTVSEGKLTDAYWSLRYELAGLQETGSFRAPRIFAGEAGAISVEVLVRENARATTAAEVRDADARARIEQMRDIRSAASGETPLPWASFTERDPVGRDVRHRYGYVARGLQVFAVHASSPVGACTDDDLAGAVALLRLDEDRGATLLAQAFAIENKRSADSIDILCLAADAYMRKRTERGLDNPPMAEVAMRRAAARLSEPTTTPDQVYGVHELMGLSLLLQRAIDPAIQWLEKAAEAAARSSNPEPNAATSHYNIACAHALAGRTDAAFAALDRAFAKYRPVGDAYLKSDADLASLHGDPRWHAVVARARPPANKK